MTWRGSGDWRMLGYSEDPVPGDADAVEGAAQRFVATARSIGEASTNLRRLDKRETSSLSVDKVLDKAHELAGELDIVGVRYDAAADALTAYAPILRQAQSVAEQAYTDAQSSLAERQRAEAAARQAQLSAGSAIDDTARQEAVEAFNTEMGRCDRASTAVDDARRRLQQAIRERDQAGDDAAARISNAIKDSPVNDTLGDRVKMVTDAVLNAVTVGAKWVWDHIDTIATVLETASALLGWVPYVGVALRVMATVALTLAAIKHSYLLSSGVVHGIRTGDWKPALVAGQGALLFLVTSKAGSVVKGKASAHAGGKASAAVTKLVDRFNASRAPVVASPTSPPHPHLPGPGGATVGPFDGIVGAATKSISDDTRDHLAKGAGKAAEKATEKGWDHLVERLQDKHESDEAKLEGRHVPSPRVIEQRCEVAP